MYASRVSSSKTTDIKIIIMTYIHEIMMLPSLF